MSLEHILLFTLYNAEVPFKIEDLIKNPKITL